MRGFDFYLMFFFPLKNIFSLVPVAHAYNPSCLGSRRIMVQSQPRQIVCETLSEKYPTQTRTGGVAQGVGPEFKPQDP
jgi:hypothetical protein